jgi:XTP/dITP diphosphohydrolase
LADDSGIVVDALGGAPGIYSARYSGEHATDADNNAKLLLALKDVPETQRSARFMCVMVFIDEDGSEHVGRGSFEGRIAFEEHGSNGFGYDPLFLTQGSGYTTTSAELPADEKNAISHRALALADLKKKLV